MLAFSLTGNLASTPAAALKEVALLLKVLNLELTLEIPTSIYGENASSLRLYLTGRKLTPISTWALV